MEWKELIETLASPKKKLVTYTHHESSFTREWVLEDGRLFSAVYAVSPRKSIKFYLKDILVFNKTAEERIDSEMSLLRGLCFWPQE